MKRLIAPVIRRKIFITFVFAITSYLFLTSEIYAQENQKDIGNHSVHYSVFNSSFLTQSAASGYGFVRARDRAIINVAVTEIGAGGLSRGLPVQLKASVANLIQQTTELEFVEVKEKDATYYLAEFKFGDADILNFRLHVLLPGERYSDTIEFSKTLYHD